MTDFVPHDFPCSAHLAVDGLVYFPRMLDKNRLQAAGRLGPEYHPFLGEGFDGRLCRFLGVSYAFVRGPGDSYPLFGDWAGADGGGGSSLVAGSRGLWSS